MEMIEKWSGRSTHTHSAARLILIKRSTQLLAETGHFQLKDGKSPANIKTNRWPKTNKKPQNAQSNYRTLTCIGDCKQ